MPRRLAVCTVVVLAGPFIAAQVVVAAPADPAAAPARRAAPPAAARRPATLADRLKADLRVQLPEDEEYCDQVATLVEQGHLPERLVTSTQAWAAAKGRKYPFPLFRKALEMKAARLGLFP
jgi:hypothetical protein